ncbi:RxLR effector protein [Phytophthora cinnamomi]|uniref:RxLR effector protein n=1 Tax=Phytophthora cinnamomi TaxID=4785 RepID=UPI00355A928B|nr:RxLR effector protein [Phytophthora cinnamomi]
MKKSNPFELLFAEMRTGLLDDAVAGTLVVGKRGEVGSSIAQKVEDVQFKTWMAEKKSADDIFKLLKLNQHGKEMFDYPQVSSLLSYMTKLDRQNAEEQLYYILRTSYGEDALALMLANSKKLYFGNIAKRLEEVQFNIWLPDGKTAMAAFPSLKLNKQGENLFESAAFRSWTMYVINEGNADGLMVSALKTTYTDDVLATMILAAKKSTTTKDIAQKLEKTEMKNWIRSKHSADAVFKLLKLDDNVDNLLTNPLLGNWVAYAEKVNENPYSILLTKLKLSELTRTDGKLADMLVRAKETASTSVIAGKLEAVQLEKWLSEGKSAEDVFKLLQLEKEGETLLWNPRVWSWVDYVAKLDSTKTDDTIASVLKPRYSDQMLVEMLSMGINVDDKMAQRLAERLTPIVLKMWLGEMKSADAVFDLVLKQHHKRIFESHAVHTWVSYVVKLDPMNPYKTMLTVLQKRFDKRDLARMLSDAESVTSTTVIATNLKKELRLSQGHTRTRK